MRACLRTLLLDPTVAVLLLGLGVGPLAPPARGQGDFDASAGTIPKDEPRAVYAADPADAWNRIFYGLFTRVVRARPSPSSTRTIARIEGGDRAIEPLYPHEPVGSPEGAAEVLEEPRFPQLRQALADALGDEARRPPLHRALLQSDIWAAHDVLAEYQPPGDRGRGRRHQLLSLLARLTRKLALTPREIDALPDNYAAASAAGHFPDVLAPGGGWIEVEYLPNPLRIRAHESVAGLRRSARVFLKPAATRKDRQEWLDGLAGRWADRTSRVDSAALLVRLLLIDDEGTVVPSRLAYEVQFRTFVRGKSGGLVGVELGVYELSRASLLAPHLGGLRPYHDRSPAYLPASGSDYGFATNQVNHAAPIVVPLRDRCSMCHGMDLQDIPSLPSRSRDPAAPIRAVNPTEDGHARHVAGLKMRREEFLALKRRWGRP
jgi:hypothetical protein